MYIISKKKDYYDGVAGTIGIDKTIVYNRETLEFDEKNEFPECFSTKGKSWIETREYPFSSLNYFDIEKKYNKEHQKFGYFIIGFCGKLYVGWKLYKEIIEFGNAKLITTITYDKELINEIFVPVRKYWGGNILNDDINYIENYNAIDIFRKYKTPVFLFDNDYNRKYLNINHYSGKKEKFIVNPNLSTYEFYKVFDSYQAFQEISMFIGGVLGNNEKQIIEVSDKNKIEQHGFDYNWSFRKEKQNK